MWEAFKDNWPGFAALFTAIGALWRNEVRTNQVYSQMFDREGNVKIVHLSACRERKAECERGNLSNLKQTRDVLHELKNLAEEMRSGQRELYERMRVSQNEIHTRINETNERVAEAMVAVANVPREVITLLRDMKEIEGRKSQSSYCTHKKEG